MGAAPDAAAAPSAAEVPSAAVVGSAEAEAVSVEEAASAAAAPDVGNSIAYVPENLSGTFFYLRHQTDTTGCYSKGERREGT